MGDAPAPEAVREGMVLRWSGEATRLDGPPSVLLLGDPAGCGEIRRRAGRKLRRIAGAPLAPAPEDLAEALPENGFLVTDGADRYTMVRIDRGAHRVPLILFEDGVPPPDRPLRVIRIQGEEAPVIRHAAACGHLICFTQGTRIRTPSGERPVEDLRPGDPVSTKDSGAQELRWVGSRYISGARMFAMPELRPVRIRAGALGGGEPDSDLWVSPEHRMLYRGPNAQALFNEPEVLVAARDLIDDRSIMVDHTLRETRYIHLLFARQEVLWANGAETESFHPGSAALELIAPDQREILLELHPEIARDGMAYGDHARRVLARPEAEILRLGGTGH
ncbi:Hint domain-containing protein [Maritimibacter sp. 55A14]|uniref:Hint domain-containing protein n=1 Tax=Maritimibacter sp. 55A14 TaxID=2174844 RepID=UPI003519CFA4